MWKAQHNKGFSSVVIHHDVSYESLKAASLSCKNMFPNTNLCLYCVLFPSVNIQCVTDGWVKIPQSVRYHYQSSSSALFFPKAVTKGHRGSLSTIASADVKTPCPPPLLAGFFRFPFVPSFSRLPPQLSDCGQRSTALSQVPAVTAAPGFTCRRYALQMWPLRACWVTNVTEHVVWKNYAKYLNSFSTHSSNLDFYFLHSFS